MRRIVMLAVEALTLLAIAACGAPGSCPWCHGGCPTLYPVELVYPAPGSSGVPAGIGAIVIQGAFDLTRNPTVSLGATTGPVNAGPLMPASSPLPSPLATPSDVAGDPLAAASIPPLSAHTTYTVDFRQMIGVDTGCVSIGKTLGFFVTQ